MKDGFALGVDRSLPGHPTYSMIEDDEGTSSEAMFLAVQDSSIGDLVTH